ncbi:MAG: universal stress protein [Gammaproteobacteria bacterium]|nr:universal stress protein [Gammaproteobacteria bacterium]
MKIESHKNFVEFAEKTGADMTVVGTHQKNLVQVFLGSILQCVLRTAKSSHTGGAYRKLLSIVD